MVTLKAETEIRVDVVDSNSPEQAAEQVNFEREDPPGTAYTVRRGDRLNFPLTVIIGSR